MKMMVESSLMMEMMPFPTLVTGRGCVPVCFFFSFGLNNMLICIILHCHALLVVILVTTQCEGDSHVINLF